MQPVPIVTRADVERIVRRDFTPDARATALAILDEYVSERGEPHRVHLAALKLAGGDLGELRDHISSARQDYRDVLAAAEYPAASARWGSGEAMSDEARRTIHDADWQQYEAWLRAP